MIKYKIQTIIIKQLPHCNYGRYRVVHLVFPFFFYRGISIIIFFYLARAHIKQPNKKMKKKNTQNIMLVKLNKKTTKN